MKIVQLLAAGALCLSGCASTPVTDSETVWLQPTLKPELAVSSPGAATLIVRRDAGGGTGMRGCNHRVLFDGAPVVDLLPSQGVKLFAPPGRHVVGLTFTSFLCNSGEGAISVVLTANEPTYLRTLTSPDNRSIIAPAAN